MNKDELTWLDKQCRECGYTPKCCACKWLRPLEDGQKKRGQGYIGNCMNPTQNKTCPNKRHQVMWNGTCFEFIWKYADGEQASFGG